ncbi:MAG: hypothetical protein ACOC4S_00670 [Balneolaceae bacterium]
MKFYNNIHLDTFLTIVLFGTLLLTGCNNPAGNDDDHEEHSDAYGLELVMNGETILRYFEGTPDGPVTIEAGEETSLITLHFLDEDGERIEANHLGDDYSLGWEVEDEDVLQVEQHDEDGEWSFHFEGITEGTSHIKFMLLHASEGSEHPDFETPDVDSEDAIEVQVE